jgi:hypothetical protein
MELNLTLKCHKKIELKQGVQNSRGKPSRTYQFSAKESFVKKNDQKLDLLQNRKGNTSSATPKDRGRYNEKSYLSGKVCS